MSVIYRSLEQLRRKQASEEGNVPQAAAPVKPAKEEKAKKSRNLRRGTKRVLIAAGGLVVLGVVALAAVYMLQDQFQDLVSPDQQAVSSDDMQAKKLAAMKRKAEEKRAAALKAAQEAARKAKEELEAKQAALAQAPPTPVPGMPGVLAGSVPAAQRAPAAPEPPLSQVVQATPSAETSDAAAQVTGDEAAANDEVAYTQQAGMEQRKALESHFADQAVRNMRIAALETNLAQAVEDKRATQERSYEELLGNVGPESLAAMKWKGYMALRDKDYALAENRYRAALRRSPRDMDSLYNLVLALFMQNKIADAKEMYAQLSKFYYLDERVLQLGRIIGVN